MNFGPKFHYRRENKPVLDFGQKGTHMKSDKLTSKAKCLVRIIKTPAGEAPLWVRKEWVGLLLPCDPYLGFPDNDGESGVITKKKAPRARTGFSVSQEKAIMILEEHDPKAAQWWKSHGFPKKGQSFGFGEDEAEIVKGVTRQGIIQVTEEMQGNPDR